MLVHVEGEKSTLAGRLAKAEKSNQQLQVSLDAANEEIERLRKEMEIESRREI